MYRIIYQESALNDMKDIISYISNRLHNPEAAEDLLNDMLAAGETLSEFPYKYQVYVPIRQLTFEYRAVRVKNYHMFYRIDEDNKMVIFTRVIYAARDLQKIISAF